MSRPAEDVVEKCLSLQLDRERVQLAKRLADLTTMVVTQTFPTEQAKTLFYRGLWVLTDKIENSQKQPAASGDDGDASGNQDAPRAKRPRRERTHEGGTDGGDTSRNGDDPSVRKTTSTTTPPRRTKVLKSELTLCLPGECDGCDRFRIGKAGNCGECVHCTNRGRKQSCLKKSCKKRKESPKRKTITDSAAALYAHVPAFGVTSAASSTSAASTASEMATRVFGSDPPSTTSSSSVCPRTTSSSSSSDEDALSDSSSTASSDFVSSLEGIKVNTSLRLPVRELKAFMEQNQEFADTVKMLDLQYLDQVLIAHAFLLDRLVIGSKHEEPISAILAKINDQMDVSQYRIRSDHTLSDVTDVTTSGNSSLYYDKVGQQVVTYMKRAEGTMVWVNLSRKRHAIVRRIIDSHHPRSV